MIAARNENYFLLRLTATVKTIIAAANGRNDIVIPVVGLGVMFPGSTSLLPVLSMGSDILGSFGSGSGSGLGFGLGSGYG